MYIDSITIKNVRTFSETSVELLHPDKQYENLGFKKPEHGNVNLLLGDNGAGKSTFLKSIAIAAMGPAQQEANLSVEHMVRRQPNSFSPNETTPITGEIEATFFVHEQDSVQGSVKLVSRVNVVPLSDEVERLSWVGIDEYLWSPGYKSQSSVFFMVAYGATRRVESKELVDPGSRLTSSLARAQRVRSIFEESFSLIPFSTWLPGLEISNPGRFTQVKNLINEMLAPTGYTFSGREEFGDYLYSTNGMDVPFRALSDGYRAYLGWIGDLLYHVNYTCPSGRKLIDNQGIVMVDEVDLHLHPKWQLTVLPVLSKALPKIQFIVTSHSPLVVGSLEWTNILHMTTESQNRTKAERIDFPIHGLDADQILLTDFFGLVSTRASVKERRLKELSLKARDGDPEAAKQLLIEMSRGVEKVG
jgi:predicted ATP-binding protein involved in virulence